MLKIIDGMKRFLLPLYVATLLVACGSSEQGNSVTDKENHVQVLLLAGQSNMEGAGNFDAIPSDLLARLENVDERIAMSNAGKPAGPIRYVSSQFKLDKYGFENSFGPEVSLAVTLGERYPDTEFLFVKTTRGGTSLYGAWNPDWSAEKAKQTERGPQKQTTQYYPLHMENIRKALDALDSEGRPYKIAGALWLQGENDAGKEVAARSYEANLKNLIARHRSDLNVPRLPFVAGQINSTYGRFKKGPEMTRAAIVRVAESDDRVAVIKTTTDRNWPDFPKHSDNVHYNTEGQIKWGIAFADALEELGVFE